MSIDPSLKVKSGLLKERNVLTRVERIEALRKARKWSEGDRVLGLPKVRTAYRQKAKPKGKKKEEEATATAATPPAAGPAAAAAKARPKK